MAFTWSGCGSNPGVKALFPARTPYQAYEHGLRQTGLHHSELGQAWIKVGQGYLHGDQLEKITRPVSNQTLKADAELVDQPLQLAAPVARIPKDSPIAVLGVYQMFQLVRLADGTLGWLNRQI